MIIPLLMKRLIVILIADVISILPFNFRSTGLKHFLTKKYKFKIAETLILSGFLLFFFVKYFFIFVACVVCFAFLCYYYCRNEVQYMKLYYDKRLKDPTYYIQIGIRNGKKVTSKNIGKIGKHSDLLKEHEDPLAYAKDYIRRLNDEGAPKKIELLVNLTEKLDSSDDLISQSTALNIGYLVFQKIYHDLGLPSYFRTLNRQSKASYDFNEVNRFLTFARILDPSSKLKMFQNKDHYFEKPSFDYQHIERFLDVLHDNYDDYLEKLYEGSNNVIERNTSVCYFDCTNYYNEIEQEDDDYIDEVTGELIKGLRKYGVSKEHRPNPIIQMGLFMDMDGIPLTMSISSGNDHETKCAVPLETKLIDQLKDKRLIYCADAGLASYSIREFNSFRDRAFIVTQSIKKLSTPLKEAVFNDCDYQLLSDDSKISIEKLKTFDRKDKSNLSLYNDKAYKVIEANTLLDVGLLEDKVLKNGKIRKVKSKATLKQHIIVTFSRKMMEYQRYIRNGQIERARHLVSTNTVTTLRKGPNDVTRFIKKVGNSKDTFKIDEEVILEEEKYDGYYAIATNLDDPAKEIINISSKRYKIEDCFRIMKTNLGGRPLYHYKREHIIGHFLICYTALLIYRLLEVKLNRNGTHFTTCQIIETIRNLNVDPINEIICKPLYTDSKVLKAIEDVYQLDISNKYLSINELNKKFKKISK